MVEFTSNYKLAKPDFNVTPWHDDVNNNFDKIDGIMFAVATVVNFKGNWTNNTTYVQGDRVTDPSDSSLWQALITHTSAAAPTTFLQDRTNNPTYWLNITSSQSFVGEWQTNTQYSTNQFLVDGHRYGVVVSNYLSGVSYDADVVGGHIITLIDATASIALAQDWAEKAEDSPVVTGKFSALHWAAKANTSATAAAGSASAAATSATNAANSATAAANSASEAADFVANAIFNADTILEVQQADTAVHQLLNLTLNPRQGLFDRRLESSFNVIEAAGMAADNENGIYIPSTDDVAYCWVRRYNYKQDVRHFGALGTNNGTAGNGNDDTNAFLGAIAVCEAHGGGEIIAPTVGDNRCYRLTAPLILDDDHISLRGTGAAATRLFIDHTGFGFDIGITRYCSWLQIGGFDIRNTSTGGDIFYFRGGAVYGLFEDMYIQQLNINRKCMHFDHDGNSTDGTAEQTIESTFQRLFLDCTSSHAHFLFYARSTVGSRFNSNVLHRLRVHGRNSSAANYSIALLADGPTGFQQNMVTSIVGEQNRGGILIAQGAQNLTVDNVANHDMTGTTHNAQIAIAQGAGGVNSENVAVRNFLRTSGTAGAGKYDIYVDANCKNVFVSNIDTMEGAEAPQLGLFGDVTLGAYNPASVISGGANLKIPSRVENGDYTPTLTNATNVTDSSVVEARYTRTNNEVRVFGAIVVTPTASGVLTEVHISLPINFSGASSLARGQATAISMTGGIVAPDGTNQRATIQFNPPSTAARTIYYDFTYQLSA